MQWLRTIKQLALKLKIDLSTLIALKIMPLKLTSKIDHSQFNVFKKQSNIAGILHLSSKSFADSISCLIIPQIAFFSQ